MIPRNNTFGATSITHTSFVLRDPAEVFGSRQHDPGDMVAALGEALARVIAARPAWHDDAACRGSGVNFTSRTATRAALELCGRCDQMDVCRQWADELGDVVAVLGGEDVAARRLRWKQTNYKPPASMPNQSNNEGDNE